MQFSRHVHITGGALRDWFVAQCYDSICVGLLWWGGLSFLHVPWAPLWAVLAALFQFIPHFGPVLTFVGPALAAIFGGGLDMFLWVLGLYGAIVLVDGLVLQPLILQRTAKVPIWASLTVPIVLSMMLGFWGLLLAAPLLAVIFAYRAIAKKRAQQAAVEGVPHQTPPGKEITGGVLLLPEEPARRDEQTGAF
jgi:predicted PurR-regulated permease PerM